MSTARCSVSVLFSNPPAMSTQNAPYPCPSCSRGFQSAKALGIHRSRYCKSRRTTHEESAKKRKAEDEAEDEGEETVPVEEVEYSTQEYADAYSKQHGIEHDVLESRVTEWIS